MHIWVHARALQADHPHGMSFGLTLRLWDDLFGTACIPSSRCHIELGFEGDEDFPRTFLGQAGYGRKPRSRS